MLDIKAVDVGIKPAYLYDIGLPVSHKLHSFISELLGDSLVSNLVSIVEIGMDCFIVNSESVKTIQESLSQNELGIKIVDITNDANSKIFDNKTILAELHAAVKDIAGNLMSDRVQIYSLTDTVQCNRTSLFGILLGYPTVYWFDESKNETHNYLSLVPLCCIQITASVAVGMDCSTDHKIETHHLYSFSYPVGNNDALKGVVDEWFETLKLKCKDTIFEDLSFNRTEKSFEAVSL